MLALILAVGSAVCLAYFIAIVIYSGIGTSYVLIWLGFAAGLGAAAGSVKLYERDPERIALWVPVSLVTLCASGMVILLIVQIMMFARIPVVAESGLDYVVVLGAQLKNGAPGSMLRLRLDKAAEYACQNPETCLILSGGAAKDGDPTEAKVMQQYLLEKGVPEEQMLLEEHSASTLENLVYSRNLLEERIRSGEAQKAPGPGKTGGGFADIPGAGMRQPGAGIGYPEPAPQRQPRIGVLTSNFHLYRARKIAQKHGLEDIYGIASESDRLLFFHFSFRDALAILKDRIAGNL